MRSKLVTQNRAIHVKIFLYLVNGKHRMIVIVTLVNDDQVRGVLCIFKVCRFEPSITGQTNVFFSVTCNWMHTRLNFWLRIISFLLCNQLSKCLSQQWIKLLSLHVEIIHKNVQSRKKLYKFLWQVLNGSQNN